MYENFAGSFVPDKGCCLRDIVVILNYIARLNVDIDLET